MEGERIDLGKTPTSDQEKDFDKIKTEVGEPILTTFQGRSDTNPLAPPKARPFLIRIAAKIPGVNWFVR